MKNCLNCKKELEQKEGKREKQFCNDKCRASYWQKNKKKKEPKYVQFKTFKELMEKFEEACKGTSFEKNFKKEPPTDEGFKTLTIEEYNLLGWKEKIEYRNQLKKQKI